MDNVKYAAVNQRTGGHKLRVLRLKSINAVVVYINTDAVYIDTVVIYIDIVVVYRLSP